MNGDNGESFKKSFVSPFCCFPRNKKAFDPRECFSSCRPKLNSKSFSKYKVSSNARTTITNFLRSHLLPARSNRSKARFEEKCFEQFVMACFVTIISLLVQARMIKSYSRNFISVSQDFCAERSPCFVF